MITNVNAKELDMSGKIEIKIPQIINERNLTPFDLVRNAGIAPGTAYKLSDERRVALMEGITFDVLVKLCEYLEVEVGDLLEYQKE